MLSKALFFEVPRSFFGLLSGKNAPFYVDALDALEKAMSLAPGGLRREVAQEIVGEVLRAHSEFSADEEFPLEEGSSDRSRDLPALILRRLVETRWLHEPRRSDYRRLILLDPHAEVMLDGLRQVALGNAVHFTDKLQGACSLLLNREGFAEDPARHLEACIAGVRTGLQELRQMQKAIERHTRSLQRTETLKENLELLYDEFSTKVGHACYRELVRAKLPTRLLRARQELDYLEGDDAILSRLQQEMLHRHPEWDAAQAADEARLRLDELGRYLESVGPHADYIDQRAAEFARRAFARFHYLQEVGHWQRDRVQRLFEWVNEHTADGRFGDEEADLGLPALLLTETGLLAPESLHVPRLRRELAEIDTLGDDMTEDQLEEALREMDSALRDSMNVLRANRFADALPEKHGKTWLSSDLPLKTDADIADVVACLLHASSRDATYSIEVPRVEQDADQPESDLRAGYRLERFILEKK